MGRLFEGARNLSLKSIIGETNIKARREVAKSINVYLNPRRQVIKIRSLLFDLELNRLQASNFKNPVIHQDSHLPEKIPIT
jgi:hypothetical protein